MRSKLEQLQAEEKEIAERLDQTIANQDEIKSRMITDRLHRAGTLSRQWATVGIEIESLRHALTQVRTQVQAELGRREAPGMQNSLHKG